MSIKELKALSYITSVAAEELPMLKWISILNSIYKDGIPEEATLATAINFYAEKFPDFSKMAEQDDQKSYDKMYDAFMNFVFKEIEKD